MLYATERKGSIVGPWLAIVLLLVFASPGFAEQRIQAQGFDVHYNTIHSVDLTPEVARAYDVTRSANRALLVIHVRQLHDGTSRAIGVPTTATARNLIGQIRKISMREIQEQESIYSIGEFPISHRERLRIDVTVNPPAPAAPIEFKFEQEFHTR